MKPTHEALLEMYENKRMTTRKMGEELGVSKTQIVRWMKSYDMPRRAANNGLENRGITPPTSTELEWMVHVEHLSYEDIADRFGVDFTAVPYWLKKHGIEKPKAWATRRKGRTVRPFDAEHVERLYAAGESTVAIAAEYGVSTTPLVAFMKREGITIRRDGWNAGHRYTGKDGHELRSIYEQRVCDWLHKHEVEHELEPQYPWDRRYMADFKAGDTYIEVWGVTGNEAYKERKDKKIQRSADAGLELISVNHWQFAQGRRWWKPLERLTRQSQHEQLSLPLPPQN